MEVTVNTEPGPWFGSWHPHLNILMEGDYFPVEELRQSWMDATEGRSETAFIKAADAGTVRELIKYVTKITDLVDNPKALNEFLNAVYKKRLVRTYGTFFRLKLEDEEMPRQQTCPDCMSTELVKLELIRPQRISMDHKGVLRPRRPPGEVDRQLEAAMLFDPKLPRQKLVNYFPKVRQRWEKEGLSFEERHDDLAKAAGRMGLLRVNAVAGWGYSEFLAGLEKRT
jgi:hypothetical protein